MSEGHCTICLKPRHLCRPHEAADRIESQAKRIEELEIAIAYAHGRLEASEGCPQSDKLAESLRMLADNTAAWIEVAVASNKSVDAYLSKQGVELPCGMPVDGVMQLVRKLQAENTTLRDKLAVVERAEASFRANETTILTCWRDFEVACEDEAQIFATLFEALEALAGDGMPTNGYTCPRCQASCKTTDGHYDVCLGRPEIQRISELEKEVAHLTDERSRLGGCIHYRIGDETETDFAERIGSCDRCGEG